MANYDSEDALNTMMPARRLRAVTPDDDEDLPDGACDCLWVNDEGIVSVAMIAADDSAPEMGFQRMQKLRVAFVLHDGELREYLIAADHIGMLTDPDVKAAFTVHESCNPLCLELHRPAPDVWSLRVLAAVRESSLRIVPMSSGLFLPGDTRRGPTGCARSFPHTVRFY